MTDNADLLRAEMDRQGIIDNELRAGLAAIIGGESGFKPRSEASYRNTDNTRIRGIFRTAFAGKSDAFIEQTKADDERFFNYVYGPAGAGPQLGNTEIGDGFKFRGRGSLQLTGRANYAELGKRCGLDLLADPDLVNDREHTMAIAVAYMRWRYKGGGWEAMKAAVGNSFGTVDAHKNALFAQYRRTGEFAAGRQSVDHVDQAPTGTAQAAVEWLKLVQAPLQAAGYYKRPDGSPGRLDGDFGKRSREALNALLRAAGQPGI
jgi:predicted chitinase